MAKGVVKFWISKKGYGFIKMQEGDRARDVFVHMNHLPAGLHALAEGMEVEFEYGTDERSGRPCATAVRLI